jgi:WD40 repeat protein
VSRADGRVVGRIAGTALEIRHLVALPDGAVVTLDAHGALQLTEPLTTGSRADRLNSLLNAAPTETVDSKAVVAAVSGQAGPPLSALGADAEASVLVVGDRAGAVRMWRLEPAPTVVGQALHQGPVTAVTCLSMDGGVSLSVSGGADGTVRLWAPGRDLMEEPADARDVPVTAVAGAVLNTGRAFAAAWSDGLVRLWDLATGEQTDLRLGFAVYALVIDADGTVIAGSGHGTTALRLTPSVIKVTAQ